METAMVHATLQSKFTSAPWIGLALSALILVFASPSSARAASCDDQKGKVIFEDTFADDSGGWEADANAKAGRGSYAIHMPSPRDAWQSLNATFNASEADYCMEFVVPKSVGPDNAVQVGLAFWAPDYENFYLASVMSDGSALVGKKTNRKWSTIANRLTDPNMKVAVDSVAVIRVHAAGNSMVFSVNGVELKTIRAQMPSGPLRFGIYLETMKDNPAGIDLSVKRIRVTEAR
jgi:hypothetical protein